MNYRLEHFIPRFPAVLGAGQEPSGSSLRSHATNFFGPHAGWTCLAAISLSKCYLSARLHSLGVEAPQAPDPQADARERYQHDDA